MQLTSNIPTLSLLLLALSTVSLNAPVPDAAPPSTLIKRCTSTANAYSTGGDQTDNEHCNDDGTPSTTTGTGDGGSGTATGSHSSSSSGVTLNPPPVTGTGTTTVGQGAGVGTGTGTGTGYGTGAGTGSGVASGDMLKAAYQWCLTNSPDKTVCEVFKGQTPGAGGGQPRF